MSREQLNSVVLSLVGSAAISLLCLAGKGWFADRSKEISDKIELNTLAITKIDATYADIVRRLDRIEGKLDELAPRPPRK